MEEGLCGRERALAELLREEIRSRVLSQLDFSRETCDEEIYDLIDGQVLDLCRDRQVSLEGKQKLRRDVFASIRRLDVLQELVDDPDVTEIMINGTDNIFIERGGHLMRYDMHFSSKEKLEDVIQQIVAGCNRVVNEASPIVDARLENGSRVNIVLSPVALNGPSVTIRRFPDRPITMDRLVGLGSLSSFLASYLSVLVQAGYNIFISGGTGSGKTTFLNALSDFVPKEERIITIEDNAELQILNVDNLVRLEARNANVEGCHEVSIRDLIRASLRMRPDRIIVGEVRGAEAIDMVQAMNTGHDGSMSTGHANSCKDMLARLETMILLSGMELPLAAVRGQLASGIDIIIQLGRLRDKSRKLLEICEVDKEMDRAAGLIVTRPLFVFEERGQDEKGRIKGEWKRVQELGYRDKLLAAGLSLPTGEV